MLSASITGMIMIEQWLRDSANECRGAICIMVEEKLLLIYTFIKESFFLPCGLCDSK